MLVNDVGGSSSGNHGIHVPDADPAQLESAAHELRSIAFGLNQATGRLQAAGRVPGWTGVASFQFADVCTSDVRGVHRGVDAMLAGARVVDRLADALREVKRKTKAAVHAAQEADAARNAAKMAAEDCREEAVRQRLAADDVQARINVRQLAGDPAPADVLAQRTAAAASATAYRQAARLDEEHRQALDALTEARAAGQRANDHYQHLASAAASAIAGLAANTPTIVHPTIPKGRSGVPSPPVRIPPFGPGQGILKAKDGEKSDPLVRRPASVEAKEPAAAGSGNDSLVLDAVTGGFIAGRTTGASTTKGTTGAPAAKGTTGSAPAAEHTKDASTTKGTKDAPTTKDTTSSTPATKGTTGAPAAEQTTGAPATGTPTTETATKMPGSQSSPGATTIDVATVVPGAVAPTAKSPSTPKLDPAESIDTVVARANAIDSHHLPYVEGAGHGPKPAQPGQPVDSSGAVSEVLGISPRSAREFRTWGLAGDGGSSGVTIYANDAHVFMKINGHFFGTSATNPGGGAGWIPRAEISEVYLKDFIVRHSAAIA